MPTLIETIESEYRRYKDLADKAMVQLSDADVLVSPADDSNSVAVIVKHVGGNLASRFTDFLTTDGEKPWRKRDEEFEEAGETRASVMAVWARGWDALFATLASLTEADLNLRVVIRHEAMTAHDALIRSLGHTASHVGQIIYVAKLIRGTSWQTLTIARGKSEEFNEAMARAHRGDTIR